jgi:chloramphenicol O-acetyltransferase type A
MKKKTMSLSVHVHHGLADGYHVGLFIEQLQQLMNE